MSEQQEPKKPRIKDMEELRRAIESSEEVIVDSSGSIHLPSDPKVANTPPQNRTALKPQRWFAKH
ncbi:hypothetical protein EKD04_015735 [Chloroflexales bacterium ZM16-3]|nr:hypothetical protein [Chloroflexales bacterium ZM16-3]